MLPSSMCGPTTETVGFFACEVDIVAEWLCRALGSPWTSRPGSFASLEDLCGSLTVGGELRRRALLGLEAGWTAVLTDGPTGTDLGMVPSLVARELNAVAVRATATDPSTGRFSATILEVFDPAVRDLLRCRRSIAAADDGGRWTFEQFGPPFEFERVDAYERRRVRDRFTAAMLFEYLAALGVPSDWDAAEVAVVLVERR